MSAMPNNRTIADTSPDETGIDDGTREQAARIAEIRRQIAAGEYDTPQRLEAALEAFLDSDDASGGDGRDGGGPQPPRHVPR